VELSIFAKKKQSSEEIRLFLVQILGFAGGSSRAR